MRLEISFRNTDASDEEKDAVRMRVERKIRKVTRFLKEPVEVALILNGQKLGYQGELQVAGAGEQTFKARLEAEDPVATVDGLIHTVERAVRRRHDRKLDKTRHPSIGMADGFAAGFEIQEDEDRDLETAEIQRSPGGAA